LWPSSSIIEYIECHVYGIHRVFSLCIESLTSLKALSERYR